MLIGGPLLMVFRPKWLYVATIFFLPFTATAAINVGSGENTSGVQASMFLGTLLMLKVCASTLWKMSFPLPRRGRMCLFWLGVFIAVTALSLIMPVWLEGHVRIPSPRLTDPTPTLIHLTSTNITSVLYMVFGYAFVYLVVTANQKTSTLRLTLKAFLAGSAFASLWGILQLACKMTGIAYPGMIFNTSKSPSAIGSALATAGLLQQTAGIIRIASVSVEPSILSQTLLVALSLCLPFVFGTDTLFSRKIDRKLFWLILVGLSITTSSTAYIGLFIVMLTVLSLLFIGGRLKPKYFLVPLEGLGVSTVLYFTVPAARRVLDMALFTKSQNYSAVERLMTINNAYEMFKKHPVLGIGWQSIGSFDLIINILANAGIIGLSAFLIAIYSIFRALYRSIKLTNRSLDFDGLMRIDFAAYVAFVVILGTSSFTGILYVFPFFWFTCGLAIAAANAGNSPGTDPIFRTASPFPVNV